MAVAQVVAVRSKGCVVLMHISPEVVIPLAKAAVCDELRVPKVVSVSEQFPLSPRPITHKNILNKLKQRHASQSDSAYILPSKAESKDYAT